MTMTVDKALENLKNAAKEYGKAVSEAGLTHTYGLENSFLYNDFMTGFNEAEAEKKKIVSMDSLKNGDEFYYDHIPYQYIGTFTDNSGLGLHYTYNRNTKTTMFFLSKVIVKKI